MATTNKTRERKLYTAKVTGRHAITLPAQLCRDLGIAVGDTVELELVGQQALLHPLAGESHGRTRPARGILRDSFRNWDDIKRFIEEERTVWEDREENPEPGTRSKS
jgi:bifunctional DNA-binding transcriptional regulator/antitoxin component of YhaV-PrlF toxin-antitoxin module